MRNLGTIEERAKRYRDSAAVCRQNAMNHESEIDRTMREVVQSRLMRQPGIHASPEWAAYWEAEAEKAQAEYDTAVAVVRLMRAEAAGYDARAAIVEKLGRLQRDGTAGEPPAPAQPQQHRQSLPGPSSRCGGAERHGRGRGPDLGRAPEGGACRSRRADGPRDGGRPWMRR